MAGKPKAKGKLPHADPRVGKEILLLWAILGAGGEDGVSRATLSEKGMLIGDDKKVRDGLEARGWIKVEKRTSRNETGKSVSGYWMTVTKAGLAWAEQNLAEEPAKSQVAAPILHAWLTRLSVLLAARNISITEFLKPQSVRAPEYGIGPADSPALALHEDSPATALRPDPEALNGNYDALRARVRQAYLAVTGNRINTRARLSDIRMKLNDINPETLDATLKRMQREQQATLYPLDNKIEITEADRNAAIYFGGEPCHILWIER